MTRPWVIWGIVTAMVVAPALAVDLTWHTVDGGGATQSAGGGFELSGTIGQPDAGDMAGGPFEINGGYWVAAAPVCSCPSDVNNDNLVNGLDVQGFVECFLSASADCKCADVDGVPGLDMGDIAAFVDSLIGGTTCP